MRKLISQKDEIPSYIPHEARFIVLGTMCALSARTINGEKPDGDFFYYNDNRNHFWKIMQYLYLPDQEPKRLTIAEKKAFLRDHGIGIQSLVSEIWTPNQSKLDPSDSVLFDCQKKKKISFKLLTPKVKKSFENATFLFTCRHKKGIENLMKGFIEANNMSFDLLGNIHFLKTPTRCNPYKRSVEWREEINDFLKSRGRS